MKRTIQYILGAAVALAITASGAFAQTVITSLPYEIDVPGSYVLQSGVTVQPGQGDWAIIITASNVDLNLNDQVINCVNGIYVHNDVNGPVSLVTVHDGTINGVVAPGATPPVGIWINGMVSFTNVTNITFTGGNGDPTSPFAGYANNTDNGSSDTFKGCTINGQLILGGDHATVMKSAFVGNAFYVGRQVPVLVSGGSGNSFKLNTVATGTVQLSGTDTYQNNTLTGGATIVGGRKLGN